MLLSCSAVKHKLWRRVSGDESLETSPWRRVSGDESLDPTWSSGLKTAEIGFKSSDNNKSPDRAAAPHKCSELV